MRWIRPLLLILVVITLLIGGAIAFLLTLDVNRYKDNIEQLVARETGRSFSIGGPIMLDLGWKTTLSVTDLALGNPDWAANPDMARVARAKIVLDVRALWDRAVILDLVEIDAARLYIEANESGQNNWTFALKQTDPSPNTEPGAAWRLILRAVHVADFELTVAVPGLPQPLQLDVDRLDQTELDSGLFDARLSGQLNGRDIEVAGQYGPLASLLTLTDLTIDVDGKFDTLHITVDSTIDDLVRPRRPSGTIEIVGPDIDDVTEMLGLEDLGGGDLDLKISLTPQPDALAFAASGHLGESFIELSGTVSDVAQFEKVDLQLSVSGPHLGNILGLFGVHGIPGGQFNLSANLARDGERLDINALKVSIGAADLLFNGHIEQFPSFDDATLKFDLHGDDIEKFRELIGIKGAATGPFDIVAELQAGTDGAELLTASIRSSIGHMKIDGEISPAPDYVGTKLSFSADMKNLGDFAQTYGISNPIEAPISIRGGVEIGERKLILRDTLDIRIGGHQLRVDGTIGYEPLVENTELRITATGSDLARIVAMAGVTEGVPAVAYDITGGLSVGPTGFEIRKLQAAIGTGRVAVDGLISRAADWTGTHLSVDVSGPELHDFLGGIEDLVFPHGAFKVAGNFELQPDALRLTGVDVEAGGARLTIDAEVGLPLESANGRFSLTGGGSNLSAVVPPSGIWEPPAHAFEIRARGKLEDGLWTFEEATANVGNIRITASGVVDHPPGLSRTKLHTSIHIPSLGHVGLINGRPLPDMDFHLEMRFAGTPDAFSVDQVHATFGKSDLSGSLRVNVNKAVPEFDLQLKSTLLDLSPLQQIDPELADDPDQLSDDATADDDATGDGRVIPEGQLPLELLNAFNARVDIDAKKFKLRGAEYDDFVFDAEVRDGRLIVQRIGAVTSSGKIEASLSIIPGVEEDAPTIEMHLDGTNVYLGLLGGRTPEEEAAAPRFDMDIDLTSSGLAYRDLAARLNGNVKITTSQGRFPNSATRFLFGSFFGELLSAINPFVQEDPYTELSCIVVLLDIADGHIAADPGLVLQTDKMNVISKGDIDLHTEKIDLNFKTAPRSKVSISAGEFINPYIKVAGTLGDPKLTLDPTGTLVTGGAAVATAGLSLIATALWDRVFREKDPCGAALAEAEKRQAKDEKKKKKKKGFFGFGR